MKTLKSKYTLFLLLFTAVTFSNSTVQGTSFLPACLRQSGFSKIEQLQKILNTGTPGQLQIIKDKIQAANRLYRILWPDLRQRVRTMPMNTVSQLWRKRAAARALTYLSRGAGINSISISNSGSTFNLKYQNKKGTFTSVNDLFPTDYPQAFANPGPSTLQNYLDSLAPPTLTIDDLKMNIDLLMMAFPKNALYANNEECVHVPDVMHAVLDLIKIPESQAQTPVIVPFEPKRMQGQYFEGGAGAASNLINLSSAAGINVTALSSPLYINGAATQWNRGTILAGLTFYVGGDIKFSSTSFDPKLLTSSQNLSIGALFAMPPDDCPQGQSNCQHPLPKTCTTDDFGGISTSFTTPINGKQSLSIGLLPKFLDSLSPANQPFKLTLANKYHEGIFKNLPLTTIFGNSTSAFTFAAPPLAALFSDSLWSVFSSSSKSQPKLSEQEDAFNKNDFLTKYGFNKCVGITVNYSSQAPSNPSYSYSSTAYFFDDSRSNSVDRFFFGIGLIGGVGLPVITKTASLSETMAISAAGFLIPMAPSVLTAATCNARYLAAFQFSDAEIPAFCSGMNFSFSSALDLMNDSLSGYKQYHYNNRTLRCDSKHQVKISSLTQNDDRDMLQAIYELNTDLPSLGTPYALSGITCDDKSQLFLVP